MPVSRYSEPRFNPYGDDDPVTPDSPSGPWSAPRATTQLEATLSLPGSKSLTNRELVLSALADGVSVLHKPLHSRDSALMIEALQQLGVTIREVGEGEYGPDLEITPPQELTGSTTIDCGLAGTVMRFVPPLAGLAYGPTTFDGDKAARRRPMSGTIDALRALGVDVTGETGGHLPFTVHGFGRITGGSIEIDASASSQFVSGVLLAAPRFEGGVDIRHTGERLPSVPHIDMTLAALKRRGVRAESPEPGRWIVQPGDIRGAEVTIEPDLSNAAPFAAAALIAGGSVSVRDWPERTTQVGNDLLDYLPLFGAHVQRSGDVVTIRGDGRITGVTLDLTTGGELAPTLVALATLADSPSRFTGIGHIRHHETDRLAALCNEINALGGDARELEDGIEVTPRPLHGGVWKAYEDHRMATAGALIGLAVDGVHVDDISTTSKTLPQFVELWNEMLRRT